jgi:hypothetical protein
LRATVPALERAGSDARLLINDIMVPERAEGIVTRTEEAQHHQVHLLMLVFFSAKECIEKNWK